MKKEILLIYCGGTIGLILDKKKEITLIPDTFEKIIRLKIKKEKINVPLFDYVEINDIIESNNLGCDEWIEISKLIESKYNDYSAFVIISGTDTLSYVGSALSFMLENLNKTVILTGSQRPLFSKDTDGLSNVVNSLRHANMNKYKEVLLCFGGELLRANRSIKVDNFNDKAFISPNFKLSSRTKNINLISSLATSSLLPVKTLSSTLPMGSLLYPKGEKTLNIFLNMKTRFLVFRIAPNFDYISLIDMLQNTNKLKMIIVELYGLGTAPSCQNKLLKLLRTCNKMRIIVLGVTQTIFGGIKFKYNITFELEKNNMLLCGDMTTESASTKLCYLYGKYNGNLKTIKIMMLQNLRGEITL
jgi:L-asparaginase/Glu-tRNA(Gln) amidotransferase subunit D